MPRYYYEVRDMAAGHKATGSDEAANQEDLIVRLQSKGLIVLSVTTDSRGLKNLKNLNRYPAVPVSRAITVSAAMI